MQTVTDRVRVWTGTTALALAFTCGSAMGIAESVTRAESLTHAEHAATRTAITPAEAIMGIERALVRVEYRVRDDKGETPDAEGFVALCSGCGERHSISFDELIKDERPAELAGYLIGPQTVVTSDPLMHPRYIESIHVRLGDQVVEAAPSAWAIEDAAVILTLSQPLNDSDVLAFAGSGTPAFAVTHGRDASGLWSSSIAPAAFSLVRDENGQMMARGAEDALLLDAQGRPIGLSMSGMMAPDATGTAPSSWHTVARDGYEAQMDDVWLPAMQAVARRAILDFRSPAQEGGANMWDYGDTGEYDGQVERVAVMLDAQHAVVMVDLEHSATARLESVRLADVNGDMVDAEFVGSFRDWGGFVVRTAEPVPSVRVAGTSDLRAHRTELLPATEVRLVGEDLVLYPRHTRFDTFELGRRGMVHPAGSSIGNQGMVFTRDAELLTLPIARRATADERSGWYSESPRTTAASEVAGLLADLEAAIDPTNIPLNEADEARIAWLGVELQPMDPDLARLSGVSEPTQGGMLGGVVNWVYPGSPAEQAGIDLGDVLVRVHADSQPRPMDVEVMGDMFGGMFPWEMLNDLPEEYFDQIPTPWPTVKSELNQLLTSLGYGTPIELEIYREGQEQRIPMVVAESPRHYGTASKAESEAVGLTVRDTTFEVRRYFRLGDDEPALIVSKLEPGGRASVAGLRPYELITEVDGEPVGSAEDLIALMDADGEVRLTVRRMTRSRVVSVKTGG